MKGASMYACICRLAAAATFLFAAAATASEPPGKGLSDRSRPAAARLVVEPGEVVRWRSPRIGRVETLRVRADGNAASYSLAPRTRNCVAYIYGQGVALRLTDCSKGRRVPYVRVRAVSAALKPVVVALRLN